MNKIDKQIHEIKQEKRLGLMTHVVIGHPSLSESRELIKIMADCKVDFIELQIPFSDPVADGPALMKANQSALDNKTTVKDAMDMMENLSKEIEIPLLFMTYFNIVHRYGIENFCKDAANAGCSGLIVPDIPLDEEPNEGFIKAAKKYGIFVIRVLSPASNERRLKLNAPLAEGFIYFASHKGTTGTEVKFDQELENNLDKVRKIINAPIAVGFGISKKEHLLALKGIADIAVVGSAITKIYDETDGDKISAVKDFITNLIL
ncbi:MAG: tryptophan synthase subunit alpha [bacterium]